MTFVLRGRCKRVDKRLGTRLRSCPPDSPELLQRLCRCCGQYCGQYSTVASSILLQEFLYRSSVVCDTTRCALCPVIFLALFDRSTVPEALAPTRPKCKTVASRAMAYKLLAAVCKPQSRVGDGRGEGREHGSASGGFDPRRNLQLLLEKGLNPLREFLSKPDVWGYK